MPKKHDLSARPRHARSLARGQFIPASTLNRLEGRLSLSRSHHHHPRDVLAVVHVGRPDGEVHDGSTRASRAVGAQRVGWSFSLFERK